jgi:20S proteasome subunit alpha 2
LFRFNEELELEDAVHTAILTLKEGFEGEMTERNIEIGVIGGDVSAEGEASEEAQFRRLSPAEVKDYLANIA